MWRPAIESDHYGDGRDLLVSALRDAAVAVATAQGTAAVVELLDRHEPALFARLALHVLAQVPDPVLVAERLTSRALFDNADTFREYTLLLRGQFTTLPAEARQQIEGFIPTGPPRTPHRRTPTGGGCASSPGSVTPYPPTSKRPTRPWSDGSDHPRRTTTSSGSWSSSAPPRPPTPPRWRHAPLQPRAKLIEVLGIMLHNTNAPTPTAVDRLQRLWEWRFDQLPTIPGADLGELAGFGWWFGSGKLDPDWALAQLHALLEAGGTVNPDHLVAGQLAACRQRSQGRHHCQRVITGGASVHGPPVDRAVPAVPLRARRLRHRASLRGTRGTSSPDPLSTHGGRNLVPKLTVRVRFPSPAPPASRLTWAFAASSAGVGAGRVAVAVAVVDSILLRHAGRRAWSIRPHLPRADRSFSGRSSPGGRDCRRSGRCQPWSDRMGRAGSAEGIDLGHGDAVNRGARRRAGSI
jgi:hypothetical protein